MNKKILYIYIILVSILFILTPVSLLISFIFINNYFLLITIIFILFILFDSLY